MTMFALVYVYEKKKFLIVKTKNLIDFNPAKFKDGVLCTTNLKGKVVQCYVSHVKGKILINYPR